MAEVSIRLGCAAFGMVLGVAIVLYIVWRADRAVLARMVIEREGRR